jgi:hypothetical protein
VLRVIGPDPKKSTWFCFFFGACYFFWRFVVVFNGINMDI